MVMFIDINKTHESTEGISITVRENIPELYRFAVFIAKSLQVVSQSHTLTVIGVT